MNQITYYDVISSQSLHHKRFTKENVRFQCRVNSVIRKLISVSLLQQLHHKRFTEENVLFQCPVNSVIGRLISKVQCGVHKCTGVREAGREKDRQRGIFMHGYWMDGVTCDSEVLLAVC